MTPSNALSELLHRVQAFGKLALLSSSSHVFGQGVADNCVDALPVRRSFFAQRLDDIRRHISHRELLRLLVCSHNDIIHACKMPAQPS